MLDRSQLETTTANPRGEVRVFRGPGAFKELRKDEIDARARSIVRRDARNSKLTRTQRGREEWLIHQAAPGLIDDRGRGGRQAKARADFRATFTHGRPWPSYNVG